jgi:hypothetical protein
LIQTRHGRDLSLRPCPRRRAGKRAQHGPIRGDVGGAHDARLGIAESCASASLGSRNGRLRWSSRHARSGRRHRAYGESRDRGALRTGTNRQAATTTASRSIVKRLALIRAAAAGDHRQVSPSSHLPCGYRAALRHHPQRMIIRSPSCPISWTNPSAQIGPRPPQSLPARSMSSGTATVIVWAASPCQQPSPFEGAPAGGGNHHVGDIDRSVADV